MRINRNVHLVGKNFSSAASRSRGGSARLRSRQAGGGMVLTGVAGGPVVTGLDLGMY